MTLFLALQRGPLSPKPEPGVVLGLPLTGSTLTYPPTPPPAVRRWTRQMKTGWKV